MIVKKFVDYIKENNAVTESDIREYIREEVKNFEKNLFIKISSQFTLEKDEITEEDQLSLDLLMEKVVDLCSNITVNNIENFDKTWVLPNEKIEAGDTVISNNNKEEYIVTRFGSNNNFYDGNKKMFISLDNVKKK